jgi:hypothetical protein
MTDDEFLKQYVLARIASGGGSDGTACAQQATRALDEIHRVLHRPKLPKQ